jgi:hypothetical protein
VTFTAGGEPVVRAFDPARLAAARVPLGDLLARLRTAPGAVHLLAAPLHLAPARLHADVTLVNGGTVVVARDAGPERVLALIAEHEVTTTFLDAAQAAALAALPAEVRDAADVLSLALLLCEAPLAPGARARLEDLAGEDVVAELRFSARAGDALLRAPASPSSRRWPAWSCARAPEAPRSARPWRPARAGSPSSRPEPRAAGGRRAG